MSIQIVLPVALAMLAGVSLVIQQILNSNLRDALDSAAWSGFVSYFVGLLSMAVVVAALREPLPALSLIARIPWWAWAGGVFGALYIVLGIHLVPQLGAATFIALLIAGQMSASVAFDHFGWLGLPQRSADLPRLAGIVLLVAGVMLIRR